MADEMSPDELQELYTWIDEVPLSRPKKNITRDFSDGVLAAELVGHFFPRWVELHNYTPANSKTQKIDNWQTLNRKVLSRLGMVLPDDLLDGVVNSKPGCVEQVLALMRDKIDVYQSEQRQEPFHPLQHCAAPGTYQNSSEMAIQHLPYAQQLQQQQSLTYDTTPGTLGFRPTFESTPQEAGESFAEVGYRDQRRHPLPAEPPPLQTSPRRRVNLDPVSSKIPLAVSRGQQDRQTHGLKEPRQSMPSLPPIVPKEKSLSAPQPKGRGEPQLRLPPVNNARRPTRREEERMRSASRRMQLAEKDQIILESQEAVQLLQMKIHRLEHLLTIKDMKIEELTRQLQENTHKKQTKVSNYTKYKR